MEYGVEADFALLKTCNFRCEYCFISPKKLGEKVVEHAAPEAWAEAFDAIGETWLIHITGGEPFVYPRFVELCSLLSRRHYLSINSNLSQPSVDRFAATLDPGRVHFVNAGLHYQERKGRLESFVRRVLALRDHGFPVFVTQVMTPAMCRSMAEIAALLEPAGVVVIPKLYRGEAEGRQFPEQYDGGERAMFLEYSQRARESNLEVQTPLGEPPSVDVFGDERFLGGYPSYLGQLCDSGRSFVKIAPDGTVLRCGSHQRLGNLLLGTMRLLDAPRPCDTSYCPYFCEKYTAPHYTARIKVPASSRRPHLPVLDER